MKNQNNFHVSVYDGETWVTMAVCASLKEAFTVAKRYNNKQKDTVIFQRVPPMVLAYWEKGRFVETASVPLLDI